MPPTWSRALSSHHHVKVLAAPPRMPPSTWLRRLRPCVLLFPRARSFRAGASLRVVVRTICLTVWLLGASVHLGKETFLTALIVQTSNMAWNPKHSNYKRDFGGAFQAQLERCQLLIVKFQSGKQCFQWQVKR